MMKILSLSAIACLFLTGFVCRVESRRNPLSGIKVPFVSKFKKKEYTPLVLFTCPKGWADECDEMESMVSEVEQELGVRVERLDVMRDPAAKATMSLLTAQNGPPFLYHRESCQTISGGKMGEAEPEVVDKARVRAWAKGRYLPPKGVKLGATSKSKNAPIVISQDDDSLDQAEMVKESSLTPEQLEGKRAMEARTKAATKS